MDDQFVEMPIDKIVEPWVVLRPVNKHSVEYAEMETSISEHGFLCSISVRPSNRQPGMYEVIDGMYRLTCAKALHMKTVPVIIKHGLTDEDVMALQISANAIRPNTKPCEFARQLRRIQLAHPGITLRQLAAMINKRPSWLRRRLSLTFLGQEIQADVDRGDICLQNAYQLARIPPALRGDYVRQAKVMSTKEFGPLAAGVLKAYQEALVQGKRDAFYDTFKPRAYLRSLKDVETEFESRLVGPVFAAREEWKTPIDGWYSALRWLMHLDPGSVRRQEDAARKRQRRQPWRK